MRDCCGCVQKAFYNWDFAYVLFGRMYKNSPWIASKNWPSPPAQRANVANFYLLFEGYFYTCVQKARTQSPNYSKPFCTQPTVAHLHIVAFALYCSQSAIKASCRTHGSEAICYLLYSHTVIRILLILLSLCLLCFYISAAHKSYRVYLQDCDLIVFPSAWS